MDERVWKRGGPWEGSKACGRVGERVTLHGSTGRRRAAWSHVSQFKIYCPVVSNLKQFWGQQTRGTTGEKVDMNGVILSHGAVVSKLCCNLGFLFHFLFF